MAHTSCRLSINGVNFLMADEFHINGCVENVVPHYNTRDVKLCRRRQSSCSIHCDESIISASVCRPINTSATAPACSR